MSRRNQLPVLHDSHHATSWGCYFVTLRVGSLTECCDLFTGRGKTFADADAQARKLVDSNEPNDEWTPQG